MSISPPTLNLVARPGVLPPQATFTRASNATRINAIGRIEGVAAGLLRHDHDPMTGDYKGWLIEAAATNLLARSEDFTAAWVNAGLVITANGTAAPDGTMTADSLSGTAGNYIDQTIAISNGTTYTISFFVRAIDAASAHVRAFHGASVDDLTLSNTATVWAVSAGSGTVRSYGNSWYRVSYSFTSTGTSLILRFYPNYGAGTKASVIWGVQVEAGAFATSYIPTTTASATRNADVLTVATSAFGFNASEGTLYVHFDTVGSTVGPRGIAALSDGTFSERIEMYPSVGYNVFVAGGGVTQASLSAGAYAADAAQKLAIAYKLNDYAMVLNGGAAQTDITATVPTVTRLYIGVNSTGAAFLNGHIRHVAYFPRRLANADLQTITG